MICARNHRCHKSTGRRVIGAMTTQALQTSSLPPRRGKLTLALLAAVAFLDFVDASIVNIALPSIRRELNFSEQGLQWVPSGYLLTYGGFMLLGGRAADLLGRRRVLVTGTVVIGLSSLMGGFAQSEGLLVAARLSQGLGAALMLPAALSILTTTFTGSDRTKALGVWGGVGGLASAVGVLLGGLLTEGPGWRWVFFVNPLAAVLVLVGIFALVDGERRRARLADLDLLRRVLAPAGVLLLVFPLVKAPAQGWGRGRTVRGVRGAVRPPPAARTSPTCSRGCSCSHSAWARCSWPSPRPRTRASRPTRRVSPPRS